MKFIKSNEKKWQNKQWYSKKVILDELALGKKWMLVQEISIKSWETAKNHYHKIQTEIFYFLNANGYWIVNGEKIIPQAGDVLVISPNDNHEVINNSDQDYIYIALKFDYLESDLYWN